MKKKNIFFSKILIAFTFLILVGIPFIWIHKTFLPFHVYIITSVFLVIIFCIYWRDFLRLKIFKEEKTLWIISLIILFSALTRKYIVPPYNFKIYDLFLIFISLSLIYQTSNIKELLIFTSILIAPLSIAELYGFMPSCILSGILLALGFLLGLMLPQLSLFLDTKNNPELIDIILLFCLCILFVIFSMHFFILPKGEVKNGRVVFDIGHESGESPQLVLNTNLDIGAGHGHGKLIELLRYYDFRVNYIENITKDELKETDVLVLIMSSSPYSNEEVKAIKEFVLNGGGLLVIGDHTDVFNVSSSFNPVIKQFGIRFLFDTIWLTTNERVNLRYRPHPIHFDLKRVYCSVGASLKTKSPARPLIQSSYSVFSDYGDPNNAKDNIYLGNAKLDKNEKINNLTLIAESQYGKGRVLVFGDSAYFQNTSLYINTLFAYRVFDWLNHKKAHDRYNIHLLYIYIIPILLIFILIFILFRKRMNFIYIFAFLVLSVIIAIFLGSMVNYKMYPVPKRLEKTILIDMAHQNEYGIYWTLRMEKDISLDGLMSQIIRLGYYPIIKISGSFTYDELKWHKAVIIICPNTTFSSKEIEAVARFCENGGGLLLVEGARKWTGGSLLWERFNLFKDRFPVSAKFPILSSLGLPLLLPYGKFEADFIHNPITSGIFKLKLVNPCEVKGGLPIAFVHGTPVINFKEFGKGKIIAIGDDRLFAKYMIEKKSNVIDREKVKFIWNIINYLSNE